MYRQHQSVYFEVLMSPQSRDGVLSIPLTEGLHLPMSRGFTCPWLSGATEVEALLVENWHHA